MKQAIFVGITKLASTETEAFLFSCGECGMLFHVSPEIKSKEVKCPNCKKKVEVILPFKKYSREWFEDKLKNHPSLDECKEGECILCGWRDCPTHDLLHYKNDGCPSCSEPILDGDD